MGLRQVGVFASQRALGVSVIAGRKRVQVNHGITSRTA